MSFALKIDVAIMNVKLATEVSNVQSQAKIIGHDETLKCIITDCKVTFNNHFDSHFNVMITFFPFEICDQLYRHFVKDFIFQSFELNFKDFVKVLAGSHVYIHTLQHLKFIYFLLVKYRNSF